MKLKDGEIIVQGKCKEKSKTFLCSSVIITSQLQGDPIKIQELFTQILTISCEGEKDSPPTSQIKESQVNNFKQTNLEKILMISSVNNTVYFYLNFVCLNRLETLE